MTFRFKSWQDKYVCNRDYNSPYDLVNNHINWYDDWRLKKLVIGETVVIGDAYQKTIVWAFDEVAQGHADLSSTIKAHLLEVLSVPSSTAYPEAASEFSPKKLDKRRIVELGEGE